MNQYPFKRAARMKIKIDNKITDKAKKAGHKSTQDYECSGP